MSDSLYSGHAFHEGFARGRAAGDLSVTAAGFCFRSDTQSVTIPLAGARLTLGGASGRIVFIAHPDFPEWSLYTSDLAILRDPVLAAHPELTAALGAMRRNRVRNWSVLAAIVALIVAIPVLLVLNMGWLAGIAARQIPASWEEQLGRTAMGQYQIQAHMIQDPQTARLLTELTDALTQALPESRFEFHFYVARDPSLNAFALPGGYVVVHSELLLRADSAEEVLGVLAHEISHVTSQHGVRNLIASAGLLLTVQAVLGDASGLLATIASAAPFLLLQTYSRSFENEADEQGFELLQRARIDGRGMVSFFEKVQAEEERMRAKVREQMGEKGAALTELPEFLTTHPATDSRIQRMRELAAHQQGPFRDLNATFAALQERIRALETEHPAEQTAK
ncbi:M48 family metallopeptidase [Steroidobacter sp. S1-65]|uniref:M48 family metallopeptidase n=1 Tax=Steroidobacter gossypii TaxID=2805490 RepID=A0ABS1X3K8_9GAMM|nr:M48 family metallopeptidase [Steroidobacter gossypii]MBM0107805.1 M48 family metallopeptidase [Steroidobacter gossypii]